MATDINPDGFAAARAGEYTQWAFRGTPSWVMNGYFTKTRDGRYRLSPAIQEMVTFRYLNLIEDPFPTECDLILCRNVIMYFARDTAVQVADRLRASLRQDGYLLVTASETGRDIQGSLTSLMLGGEIVYKRTPPAEAVSTAPAAKTPARKAPAADDQSNAGRAVRPRPTLTTKAKKVDTAKVGLRLERRAYSREDRPVAARNQATGIDAQAVADDARRLADRGQLDEALERCNAALTHEKLNPSLLLPQGEHPAGARPAR